jgi:hypothetical protein
MKCLACGAEMRLMQVDLRGASTSEMAFERHTFKCSACPQISHRPTFSRPRLPVSDLLVAARPRDPPADKLQLKRAAAESALAKVVEKLRSRQVVTQARASAAMASIWQEVFEKLQGQAAPVQDWAKKAPEARPVQVLRSVKAAQDRSAMPAMTSTWAEVVEKVRRRQLALKDRAGTSSSSQRR